MQSAAQTLLKNLCHGHAPLDESPSGLLDDSLNLLHNCDMLSRAWESLQRKSQDKSLDVVFQARISATAGVLNIFLNPELPYTWRGASMIVAKAQGHESSHVHSIWAWVLDFVHEGTLPLHSFCYTHQTVLEDDDIVQETQWELTKRAKGGCMKAEDDCEIVASKKLQAKFARLGVHRPTILKATAHRWLAKLKWRYEKKKNRMYIDGHERDDIVAYWHTFVLWWAEYGMWFPIWGTNENPLARYLSTTSLAPETWIKSPPLSLPLEDGPPAKGKQLDIVSASAPAVVVDEFETEAKWEVAASAGLTGASRPLILITHDESVFYQNDEKMTCWSHQDSCPAPEPKGDGQSLMVSDLLTTECGSLHNGERWVFFFLLDSLLTIL